jgi:hypothetical protein
LSFVEGQRLIFSQLLRINFVEERLSGEPHESMKRLFRVYCERRFTTEAPEHAEFGVFLMKNFTLRPPCLGGEISESFFTTE